MEQLNDSLLPIGVCRINSKNVWGRGLGKDCDLSANSWYHFSHVFNERIWYKHLGREAEWSWSTWYRTWFQESRHFLYSLRCKVRELRRSKIPCLLEDIVVIHLQWTPSATCRIGLILTTWCVMFIVWRKERGAVWFNWLKCSWRELWRCSVELGNLGRSLKTESCPVPLSEEWPSMPAALHGPTPGLPC